MGRMVFHIIPRDGKPDNRYGELAQYDRHAAGRYEMYITDYADDICEGETQTAKRAWCEDSAVLLNAFIDSGVFCLLSAPTIGELQRTMSANIESMNEFYEICDCLAIKYDTLPLLIERHD